MLDVKSPGEQFSNDKVPKRDFSILKHQIHEKLLETMFQGSKISEFPKPSRRSPR